MENGAVIVGNVAAAAAVAAKDVAVLQLQRSFNRLCLLYRILYNPHATADICMAFVLASNKLPSPTQGFFFNFLLP